MSYGDNKIEFYTYSPPSLYGSPIVRKIGINKKEKYYLKNNYVDIGDKSEIRGIGLVESKASDENWLEFKSKYKELLNLSKKNDQFMKKADKIIGRYIENSVEHIVSAPVTSAAYKDKNAKEFENWFKEKFKIYDDINEFKLSKGFYVEDKIIKKNGNYLLVINFVNPTNFKVGINNIKAWGGYENSDESTISSHLSIYNGLDFFNVDLTINNIISGDDNQDTLYLDSGKSKEFIFSIDNKKIKKINDFFKENPNVKLKFNTKFNLEFVYPSEISGKFNYATQAKDFIL
ncbi:hypothetical protein BEN71_16970 [Acinetobacter wuhouensis]|nr:hypothetical protein BEN71_16970 [Acinetobacter wuhouensis]